MPNPFKVIEQERVSRWEQFKHLFDQEEPKYDLEVHARDILNWCSQPYHKKFVEYLAQQCDREIDPRLPSQELLVGTARINAFREIRRYLKRLEDTANDVVGGS